MEQKSFDVLQFIEELAANSLQRAQILSRFAQLYKSAPDIIEKNLHEAINLAGSKADACRRIMALETYGYIVLSNVHQRPRSRTVGMINPKQIVCAIIEAIAEGFKEIIVCKNPRENAYQTAQTTKNQYYRDKNTLFE